MNLINLTLYLAIVILILTGIIFRYKSYMSAGGTKAARGLIAGIMPKSSVWVNERSYSYFYKSQVVYFWAGFFIGLRLAIPYFQS